MKTDKQLQIDIKEELKWEPRVRDEEIGIEVRDGVVTLMGTVPDYAQRSRAVRAVERVAGVRAVAQELTVKVPNSHMRSDTDLAHQVVNALAWDTEVPFQTVKAKVDDGWVTLEGEVEWQFQRNAPERAVRYLSGVKGVSNLLTVKAHASTYHVAQHISAALTRSAEADSKKINVTATGGKVTLTGTVRSWPERADAERGMECNGCHGSGRQARRCRLNGTDSGLAGALHTRRQPLRSLSWRSVSAVATTRGNR